MTSNRKTSPGKQSSFNRIALTERLICAEKIISTLSHVIRNPLNAMKGAATLLSPKFSQDHRLKRLLDIIASEVDRLDSIIHDLHIFSLESPIQKQPSDLHALIEDVLISFKNRMDLSDVTVTTNFDQNVPLVSINPMKMREALSCLVANSLEAMEGKGALTVSTRSLEAPHQLAIHIQDTGHGISAENMERLFEPLFSTKQKGYGLGLSIASQTLMKHGGTIDIKSLPGKGTTVSMMLP